LEPIVSFSEKYSKLNFVAGALTQRLLDEGETVSYYTRQLDDGRYFQVYNSALLVSQTPEVQVAHKRLLVTGVEKMPFEQYFSFLKKFFVNAGGISGSLAPAKEIKVLQDEGNVRIGPVICFESVFGGHVGRLVANGANILFVITNDGWLKSSPGIRQHFNYSRLRAIETRRWVVRSANTGISGIINARGELVRTTEVNTITAFREQALLNDSLTFYVQNGDMIGRISLLLSIIYCITIFFDAVRRLLYSML
jgi:apolipoprotein N-acyltransferase